MLNKQMFAAEVIKHLGHLYEYNTGGRYLSRRKTSLYAALEDVAVCGETELKKMPEVFAYSYGNINSSRQREAANNIAAGIIFNDSHMIEMGIENLDEKKDVLRKEYKNCMFA